MVSAYFCTVKNVLGIPNWKMEEIIVASIIHVRLFRFLKRLPSSQARPLSVPFLLRTSGKGTDTATMLRLEKYGRIDFPLGGWTTTDQNAPKSTRAHVKLSGDLAKIKICSLSRPQRRSSHFFRGHPSDCTKME